MYSAVHHEGRRLYELAREGVEVAREAREVVVHAMEVLALDGDRVTVRVVCGKGTYVRALAADLGADLGCGGAVERLVRVRVGPFTREGALSSDDLLLGERTALLARVLPVDAPLAGWPSVALGDRDACAFIHGQHVPLPGGVRVGSLVSVRDGDGRFLGVGRTRPGSTRVAPERIVHADRPRTRVLPA
jgi:tRNA pseudouridine55 synthase